MLNSRPLPQHLAILTGDSSTITPDLFTGTFSYDVPLKVAPGRHGIEPKIVMKYRSATNLNFMRTAHTGMIELGGIERSAMGMGVNYSGDRYLLRQSSGDMAMLLGSNGTYRTVIEKEFLRIKKLVADDGKPYWQVTDKSGIRYTFGRTAASRLDNPSDSSKIFRWCLDRVEDTNGNYMSISYFKNGGMIYLDCIDYTGFNDPDAPQYTLQTTNSVKFNWDFRDFYYDLGSESAIGFSIRCRYRLKDITVKTPSDLLGRGYTFTYNSTTSLLEKIQEFNNDRPDSIPPPPTIFTRKYDSVSKSYRLTEITNGSGGKTAVTYQDTQVYVWSNNGTSSYKKVPTLASITRKDGNGTEATTTYAYSGGFHFVGTVNVYTILENEFRGFNLVTVTDPAGPDNKRLVTETWFHQGNDTAVGVNTRGVFYGYTKGLPYKVRVSDSTGKKYSETTISYKADVIAGSPFFTPTLQIDEYNYEGESTARQTRTVLTYDQEYGNLTREDRYGDLADGTDDLTIVRAYSPNVADWIVGLPTSMTTYKGIGTTTKVAGTTNYYDDLTDCQAMPTNNQTPVKGNLTRTVKWNDRGAAVETRIGYDAYGNASCSRDPRENGTAIAYDSTFTFPTSVVNPLSQETITQYYGVDGVATDKGIHGQVKSVIDANNAATVLEYDGYGRKIRETSPEKTWTAWSYSDLGMVGFQRIRTDTSTGEWQESYFDGFGRTFKARSSGPDAKTIVTDTVYDLRGAVQKTSLPRFEGEAAYYTLFETDPVGRTTKATKADNTRGLACYNARLGVTVTIDGENHRKRETRDASGRLVTVEEYTGTYANCDTGVGTPYAKTTYQYDVLGNLRLVTDAKGNKTEVRYDSLGRKYWMHDPDMGDWSYDYDASSNLISQTDAKLQKIDFIYDPLNRVTLKDYPTGTDVVYIYDEATSTNGIGRLTTMSDTSGITKYFYDQLGRATNVGRTIDGTTYTIGAAYDGLDRIKSLTYPDGDIIDYSYDEGGNLRLVGTYADYADYNASGKPRILAFGNGVTTAYQYYSTNNRLQSTTVTSATQGPLLNLAYGYYNNGNVKAITDNITAARNQSFIYDELDRLLQAKGSYGTLSYTYNQIGNFLTKEGVRYTYGGPKPHAVMSTSNGRTFSYDSNGNMNTDGQRTITYNFDNLPATINESVSITYDGTGSRVKKFSTFGITYYIDKLFECRNQLSAPLGFEHMNCSKYIFAGDTLIGHKIGGQTFYYHSDHLGSTRLVTDTGGNTAEEIAYYPFGKPNSETGTVQVSHLYTGQELDGETELYNYNARLYDSEMGRFISADTVAPDPSKPQSLNRYSYAVNSPLNYVDPTGHWFVGLNYNFFWDNWQQSNWQFSFGDNNGGYFSWSWDAIQGYFYTAAYGANAANGSSTTLNYKFGGETGGDTMRGEVSEGGGNEFAISDYLPDAQMIGVSNTLGIALALNGGAEIVINSKSGEVSLFFNGGFEGGLCSYGPSVKAGFIMNLPENSKYRGPFLSANFAKDPIGISLFATSDKLLSPYIVPGPYGLSVNLGATLVPYTVSESSTQYKEVPRTIPYLGYAINPLLALIKHKW